MHYFVISRQIVAKILAEEKHTTSCIVLLSTSIFVVIYLHIYLFVDFLIR
jgi:hypothetical protein